MFRPLSTNRRKTLLRVSLSACVAAIALLPIALPWNIQAHTGGMPAGGGTIVPVALAPIAYPSIVVSRDPFVSDDDSAETPALGGEPGFALPPNDAVPTQPLVRAVILGPAPRALVDISGRPQLVGIGSRIAGDVVTAITAEGVSLGDGVRLPFSIERP